MLRSTRGTRHDLLDLALTAGAVTASLLVIVAYVVHALALIAYPWDWSPDEGLFLDYARRLLEAPATLHGKSFVPYPSVYGPVLPIVLAPALALSRNVNVLSAARVIALGWTLLGVFACFSIVRRTASPAAALAAAALALAPFDLTFWHMLIRPDGLHQTLWLLAAAVLLPRALCADAERLSPARLALGTALVLAAILAKATAVLLCAPLVLGWFLVDRRSALRLALALGLSGLVVVSGLQWATGGGFLWVSRAWQAHHWQTSLPLVILASFVRGSWPVLLLCGVASAVAAGRRPGRPREAAILLVLGAATILPLTAKYGAWWNYLLPLLPALVILAARLWATRARPIARIAPATCVAVSFALVALLLAATHQFPLPTRRDEATATALYGFIGRTAGDAGGPILAIRPEMAYVVARQPVEMEGSGYLDLANAGAPGTDLIRARLRRATYSLVVVAWPWQLPDDAVAALAGSYRVSGVCSLGYFYGQSPVTVFSRGNAFRPMPTVPGTRCGANSPATNP